MLATKKTERKYKTIFTPKVTVLEFCAKNIRRVQIKIFRKVM